MVEDKEEEDNWYEEKKDKTKVRSVSLRFGSLNVGTNGALSPFLFALVIWRLWKKGKVLRCRTNLNAGHSQIAGRSHLFGLTTESAHDEDKFNVNKK